TYTEEQRAEALKLYAEVGPAEAARRLPFEVSAATVRKWASRAGLRSERASRTRAATEAAMESYRERRTRLSTKFAQLAEECVDKAREANPSNCSFLTRSAH